VKACIGEEDIEFTPLFNERIDYAFSRFDICYISLQCERVISKLLGGQLTSLDYGR
jgi:hypothetical protein